MPRLRQVAACGFFPLMDSSSYIHINGPLGSGRYSHLHYTRQLCKNIVKRLHWQAFYYALTNSFKGHHHGFYLKGPELQINFFGVYREGPGVFFQHIRFGGLRQGPVKVKDGFYRAP